MYSMAFSKIFIAQTKTGAQCTAIGINARVVQLPRNNYTIGKPFRYIHKNPLPSEKAINKSSPKKSKGKQTRRSNLVTVPDWSNVKTVQVVHGHIQTSFKALFKFFIFRKTY